MEKSESGHGERTEPCDAAERLMKMCCLHPTAVVTQIQPVYWEEWRGRPFVLTAHWLFRECSATLIVFDGELVAVCGCANFRWQNHFGIIDEGHTC